MRAGPVLRAEGAGPADRSLSARGGLDRIAKRREAGLTPAITLAEAGLDSTIRKKIDDCVDVARRAAPHIDAAGEPDSLVFLGKCGSADRLLLRLVRRDGVVIVLRDEEPGHRPAFGPAAVLEDDSAPIVPGVPELLRIANLLLLTDDLAGAAK